LSGKLEAGQTFEAFTLPSGKTGLDANFAMHIPRKSHLCTVVDVIARWAGDQAYASITRQGNFVMIGLAAPPKTWTPKYTEFFRCLAVKMHEKEKEPFSTASWQTTKPGTYEFTLARGRDQEGLSSKTFFLLFPKPTRFSARLEHKGSQSVMLLFMGENRRHWERKDAYRGEPLEITCDISQKDVKDIGDGYWELKITNFDRGKPAACKLVIKCGVDNDAGAADSPPIFMPAIEPDEPTTFRLRPRQDIMGKLLTYYRPTRTVISDEPQEHLKAEPEYEGDKPLYGTLTLGDGSDNQITVVLDEPEEGAARIYIDRNNDEDLTNDGDGQWTESSDSVLGLSGVAIDVPYKTGAIPYTFKFYRFKKRLRDCLLYYRDACREGEVTYGARTYKIAVLDENADGRFDDLENGTLLIDLNQDGKLVGKPESAEFHKMGEPFNIHGTALVVASISPDGTSLRISPSDADVEMKPYLDEGFLAPSFAGTGLDEMSIDLREEAADAKYVLLDFWASWCGPCCREFPHLSRLHARYKNHGLRIIGINLDSDREKAMKAVEDAGLNYPHVFDGGGWKSAVATLYRVHGIPTTYLLDENLKIVAKGLRGERMEHRIRDLLGQGDEEVVQADTKTPKPKPMSKTNDKGDTLTVLGFDPPLPAVLEPGKPLKIRFSYTLASGDSCRIWARPYANGRMASGYGAHGSPSREKGSGEVTGWFNFNRSARIDQVRILMAIDDSGERSELKLFVDANAIWQKSVPLDK